MSYIGNEPIVSATRTITEVTATAGQTVFTANGGYTVGYIDVFLNGAQLQTVDFTATNGSSITLTESAQVGDVLKLVAWGTFQTSSALTANNPSYTGTLTGGTGVVNIGSGQVYKDASGNLGIGTSSPTQALDVNGNILGAASITIGTSGLYQAGSIYSDSNWGMLFRAKQASPVAADFMWANSAGTERMRIDSSGNLAVGTTGFGGRLSVSGNLEIAGFQNTSGTGNIRFFNSGGSTIGYIQWSGSTTSYVTSSDYRLKENIAPMTGALDVVQALKPVTYTWKADGSDGQGFIAHELQAVVPDCVTGEKDAVDADGKPVYQGIDTSFLVATLTAAIKEQQAQLTDMSLTLANANAIITEQSLALTDLKSRIETLESK